MIDNSKNSFFQNWFFNPENHDNLAALKKFEHRDASLMDFPSDIEPSLRFALQENGISQLYDHQFESWQAIHNGKNIVVTTGTASGKTLCYNLPVLDALLKYPDVSALYIFPTKALTYDQFENLGKIRDSLQKEPSSKRNQLRTAVYDGDTPDHLRSHIRKEARILLTNPDMIHLGMLPHHTLWSDFFRNLKFVVIDEIHYYRGVFGSHVANVVRRLQRVAHFYGSYPQVIMTSATIANAKEFAEKLIEAPVQMIDKDASPRGEKIFAIYNPPLVDEELGIRKSSLLESVRISRDFLDRDVQLITFVRTRRSTEMILKYLIEQDQSLNKIVRGYRSGYLPAVRREIELGLRNGMIKEVVATNALELGIDIGGMDAVQIVGYPGTIASLTQQSGRAGRRKGNSVSIMIASANPIDQYLVNHPEYVFQRSPEKAMINPDNALILFQHLRCAAFELPFAGKLQYGDLSETDLINFLQILVEAGDLYERSGNYYWANDQYPSGNFSLRSAGGNPVSLKVEMDGKMKSIGEVDEPSSYWMVHPGAVYLQEGQSFVVKDLNLQESTATLISQDVDYYTVPQEKTEIELVHQIKQEIVAGGNKNLGELLVKQQVTGFKKFLWETRELLSLEPLEMPETQLRTVGYWFSLDEGVVDQLRSEGVWQNDKNDYGSRWNELRKIVRERDHYICQVCGKPESGAEHHVHHKIPFRQFSNLEQANRLENLITLCPTCHQRAELSIRIRSGLSGLQYILNQLAPLFIMCDSSDLGSTAEPQSKLGNGVPTVIIYDQVPGGIGLSDSIYDIHDQLMIAAKELILKCGCKEGCPACVGPSSEKIPSGKKETLAILNHLLK
jgi:DEAD/DEAH box helicase domain-containing protein